MDEIRIYTDGGSRGNPGPAAIGVVITDSHGRVIESFGEAIGFATNNEAEYRAVVKGLEAASKHTKGEVILTTDSVLVSSQLSGKFRIKQPHLRKLAGKVREMEKAFARVSYTHARRVNKFIQMADRLVNSALDRT